MKQDSSLRNNLKSIRTRLAMSQQDLANIAGVTRQTISGVESGQYAPSVEITLRLAKALGCQVEHLFWLERDLPEIEAIIAKFHVSPIIIADWRCPLTGPTCCNSINSSSH